MLATTATASTLHPATASLFHAAPSRPSEPARGRAPVPALSQPRPVQAHARGTVILHEGDAATHCYEVVSGLARTCKLLADGRRLIGEFLMPGDVFGFELGQTQSVDVEAVTATSVVRLPLARVRDHADDGDATARRLHRLAFEAAVRTNTRLLLLPRQTAQERVAGFILEIDRRLERPANRIELPMTRQDVADYLCLTIETVCRTLGELRRAGAIAIDAHHAIMIRNREILSEIAGQ